MKRLTAIIILIFTVSVAAQEKPDTTSLNVEINKREVIVQRTQKQIAEKEQSIKNIKADIYDLLVEQIRAINEQQYFIKQKELLKK